ncbi:histidine kinase [Streptomyces sp. NPDC021212]|uniref:histidine kinase n=1 Tax=Streptomyces sp. NPDC021212 TaxID=3365118 RepID=UPI00379E9731
MVLGLCLRLYDALRFRRREAILQEQRLEHARELHDFVAHHVTAIVARTKAARFTAAVGHTQSPEDLDQMLAHIERAGSQALGSMRAMVSSLRAPSTPAATSPTGGLAGLRALTRDFSAAGPAAELTLDPRITGRPLPPEITTAVHRLVQESLTNIRKHAAGAARVEVRVTLRPGAPEELEVSVADDGSGGAPAGHAETGGGGAATRWRASSLPSVRIRMLWSRPAVVCPAARSLESTTGPKPRPRAYLATTRAVTRAPSPSSRSTRPPTGAPRDPATSVETATVSPVSFARRPSRTSRSRTPGACASSTSAEPLSTSGSPSSRYGHTTVVEVTGAAARTPGVSRSAGSTSPGTPPSPGALNPSCARVASRRSPEVAARTVVWVRV